MGTFILQLLWNTLRKFWRDGGTHMAAGLAYYALLAMFPFTLGLLAILGYYLPLANMQEEMLGVLKNVLLLPPELIERNVSKIIEFRNALGVVSIIILLWAISGVFGALNRSMNQAWNVQRDRNYLIRKFRDLLMALSAGTLLLLSIETNSLFPILRGLGIIEASLFLDIAGKLLSMLFVGIAFILIYKFVPNEKIRWKYIWPGTIFGIVFFDAAKSLFVVYLANFANYEMIYGSIASVIVLLVWIYYSAIILIVGAELNSEYARMTVK
ncbi:YihY/virulence factor BrkB family protein [Chloroflexota bacterium]